MTNNDQFSLCRRIATMTISLVGIQKTNFCMNCHFGASGKENIIEEMHWTD